MSLMEMGKCLLKCARESDVEGVKKAVYYGAPFSSDWVLSKYLKIIRNSFHRNLLQIINNDINFLVFL